VTGPPSDTEGLFAVSPGLRRLGLTSWLALGIVAVLVLGLVLGLVLLSILRLLVLPTLFAALLGSTFLPVVDWLERHRFKRWLAALIVMLLIFAGAALVVVVVVVGVFHQFPTVRDNLNAALTHAVSWLNSHDVKVDRGQVASALKKAGPQVAKGVASTLLTVVNSLAAVVFGVFIGLNILVYILADGRRLGRWLSFHVPSVPQPIAYGIIASSSRSLRAYIWGSTIIGAFNGVVMGLGALVLGVPLALTIGIVGWLTNYIPTFGAIIGGAFAVVIAFGAGGLTKALLMLVVVIVANGSLQTVVSQFALGAALKLHPLAVLFATTAGGLLFGGVGALVAAPFLKIALDAQARLREAGLIEPPRAGSGPASPRARVTGDASAGAPAPDG
jgi:predicted PurR-regulated permease PerM